MVEKAKGFFDYRAVTEYLAKEGDLYEDSDLAYFYTPEVAGPIDAGHITNYAESSGACSISSLGKCLCLDVGCWTGDPDAPEPRRGAPDDPKHHFRHRDFGIVSGGVAVLCKYSPPNQRRVVDYARAPEALEVLGDTVYLNRIVPLLNHLSAGALGTVEVVSALAVSDPRRIDQRLVDRDHSIHVFIGDLHLPIITDEPSTYIRGREPENTGLGFSLDVILAAMRGKGYPNVEYKNLRAGRLSLSAELNLRVGSLVFALGMEPTAAALCLASTAAWIHEEERIKKWEGPASDGTISDEEAKSWFEYYHGKDRNKGADIFQGAAKDLVTFLDLLSDYHAKGKGPKLNVVQMGDFCDFWIGLKCAFGKNVALVDGASDFVDVWYDQTKAGSGGAVIAAFDELSKKKKEHVSLTYLHGNHDNYLRGKKERQPEYKPDGSFVFAEHGHQSDSFNCDDDATMGWAITQAVFLKPEIRAIEDFATGFLTKIQRAWPGVTYGGSRLGRMARAADVCLSPTRPKLVYVLAHTHRPMLRRISVDVKVDCAEIYAQWYNEAVACVFAMSKEALSAAKDYACETNEQAKRWRARLVSAVRKALEDAQKALDDAEKNAGKMVDATREQLERDAATARRMAEEALDALANHPAEAFGVPLGSP